MGAESFLGGYPRLQKFHTDFASHPKNKAYFASPLSKLRINNTMVGRYCSDSVNSCCAWLWWPTDATRGHDGNVSFIIYLCVCVCAGYFWVQWCQYHSCRCVMMRQDNEFMKKVGTCIYIFCSVWRCNDDSSHLKYTYQLKLSIDVKCLGHSCICLYLMSLFVLGLNAYMFFLHLILNV